MRDFNDHIQPLIKTLITFVQTHTFNTLTGTASKDSFPSVLYLLPLLPAGLWCVLYFVSLVRHDNVFLLHQSPSPPQHTVGAQRPRTLIGWAILLPVGHVKAGRPGGQRQTLWDGVRDLKRAGASSLSQAMTSCWAALPPGLGVLGRQGGLDMCLSCINTAGCRQEALGRRDGDGLVWTGQHLYRGSGIVLSP